MDSMKSPLTVENRRRLNEGDPRWHTKAILRIVASLFALVALVLFSVAVASTNKNFINTSGNGDWTDGLAIAPTALSLLYNACALTLPLLLHRSRPLHPAWHLGGDLLVWALCVPSIIFAVGGGVFWYWTSALSGRDGAVDCAFFFNVWAQQCNGIAYTVGHEEIAGIVLLFLVFLIHLTLFAGACVETHRWRKGRGMGRWGEKGLELREAEQGAYSP